MIAFSANAFSKAAPSLSPPICGTPRNSHMQTFLKIVSPHAPVNSLSPRFFTPLQGNGYNTKSSENTKKYGRKGQTRDL